MKNKLALKKFAHVCAATGLTALGGDRELLSMGKCRYIIGYPTSEAGWAMCGRDVKPSSDFCQKHHDLCYIKVKTERFK